MCNSIKRGLLQAALFSLLAMSCAFAVPANSATAPPVISGRQLTAEEWQRSILAGGMAASLSKQYDVQTLGTYPRDGQKRPVGASALSRSAVKEAGYDPSENVQKLMGGQKGYDYRLHANAKDSKSFFLELRPTEGPDDAPSTWLLLKPKPGVDPSTPTTMTPEEQAAMGEKMNKIVALGGLDSTTPEGSTMGRLFGVFQSYDVPIEHLNQALPDPQTNAPGDRRAIGIDMVRLHQQNRLEPFCKDAVDAAMPAEMNQDGTRLDSADPQYAAKLEANQIRNEIFADNLHGAVLSELLLNGKITTKDGRAYKHPDEAANEINQRLIGFAGLRKKLRIGGREAFYFDEALLWAAAARGEPVRRDDLLRKPVLSAFTDLVTPEAELSVPKFTWGNQVEFLGDGATAFEQRLSDLKVMSDLARRGQKTTYDFTIWKLYANRPMDSHQLGAKMTEALLKAADNGVDEHITVDRSVAMRDPGAMEQLTRLDAHRNIVVNWFNNDARGTPGDANHAKSAISDGYLSDASAIVGGRNIHGDYYFDWMDAEFRIEGELAQHLQRAEDDMWGQQAKMQGRPDVIRKKPGYAPTGKRGDVIGLATHEMPGPDSRFNGLIGILAGLEMSDKHYTLVQAYVLPPVPGATLDPTVEAIKRAVAAGKEIDIVTNSPESIDTPQISGAIVKYAAHLLEEANKIQPGALRIFMKKKWEGIGGSTLHAKVTYDDSWWVSDTSNNLHANGFLQHEGQRYYLDDEFNDGVRQWGERLKDPSRSTLYTEPSRLLKEKTPTKSATDPALDAILGLFPYQL